jgi:hypothetical protein
VHQFEKIEQFAIVDGDLATSQLMQVSDFAFCDYLLFKLFFV